MALYNGNTHLSNAIKNLLMAPWADIIRMKVAPGDTLHVVETPEGYLLTPFDPEVAAQVEAGREFMKEIPRYLQDLAE
jgi:hypothetical protein